MLSTKDLFNAKNNGKKVSNDLHIMAVDTGAFKDTDKDGKEVMVSCIKDTNGDIYTSISATIYSSLEMLQQILDESGTTEVVVHEATSQGGRNFLQLSVI